MQIDEILQSAAGFSSRHVTVTGGEPLAQKDCLTLLARLCDTGYHVSLETSGALDISPVDPRVIRVMDIKTPSSGEQSKNLWDNIDHLTARDQVKFVIANRVDYDWARHIVYEDELCEICEVLFSPVYKLMDAQSLAEWILQDRLPVRFQLQLHKQIWGEEPGR
jgi:7-carboxy-7-deazaguanine synthase